MPDSGMVKKTQLGIAHIGFKIERNGKVDMLLLQNIDYIEKYETVP